jgi:hypothetical protein
MTVPPCAGDCNSNDQVTVDEILTMVNIALENANVETCEAGDTNADGRITVDEILAAVDNALNGCGSSAVQMGAVNDARLRWTLARMRGATALRRRYSQTQTESRRIWETT